MVDFDDLETPVAAFKTAPTPTKTVYVENCKKCNGTGRVTIGYMNPRSVVCFGCDGIGKHEFKTSQSTAPRPRPAPRSVRKPHRTRSRLRWQSGSRRTLRRPHGSIPRLHASSLPAPCRTLCTSMVP